MQKPNLVSQRGIKKDKKLSKPQIIKKDFFVNYQVYIMAVPMVIFFILFHYMPMYGIIIAFKDFTVGKGIFESEWIGFENFIYFFNSHYFTRVIKNTVLLSLYGLLWGFPAPIILAILLNELHREKFKRLVQTISYLPHFISMVVICGIIIDFCSHDGLINDLLVMIGYDRKNLLINPNLFRTIYISSNIWKEAGWGSIIYLGTLTNIDPALYEAATIDGARRFRKIIHITLPGIAPTIIILLILRLGHIMNTGFEKIILLYNPMTYETADVISSFVYRKGLVESNYSFSTAVGLFNSAINFGFLLVSNSISRKVSKTSLW